MKRIIPILFLISILSPIASSQGQPETPQWTIDWVTDMERPVEFESSSPSYAKEIWISLEFYVENTRPTPVSLVLEFEWDEDNQIFWPKKPYASWVKNTTTAAWDSPIGPAPALTAEQESQNAANTHQWFYEWNEEGQSWDLTDNKA